MEQIEADWPAGRFTPLGPYTAQYIPRDWRSVTPAKERHSHNKSHGFFLVYLRFVLHRWGHVLEHGLCVIISRQLSP